MLGLTSHLTCFFVGFSLAWACCWWQVARMRRWAKVVHMTNVSLADQLAAAREAAKGKA